jgi:hypothetical protein
MVKKHGVISINRKDFGTYEVPGVLHFACEKCGDRIIPPGESNRIMLDGLKLHTLKVLNKEGATSILNLSSIIGCEPNELDLVLTQLKKEKLILLSDKGRFPTVSLAPIKSKKKDGFLSRLIAKYF